MLGGVSAGSLCWHVGGTTDSFGPDLRPVTNGLGFIPTSNGVHYDSEEQRRPLYHRLVAEGALPAGHATDDGVGLVYRGHRAGRGRGRPARRGGLPGGARTRRHGGGDARRAAPPRLTRLRWAVTELRIVRAGLVAYEQAWERQRELHAARVAGEGPDTLLLLEHPSVYTAGKRTEPHERPFDGTPVIDVDRGGKITWHGPGQLVGYPIVRAARPDRRRRLRPPARGGAHRGLRRLRAGHRPGRGPQRRLGGRRRPPAPTARSPRSASGWPAA